MTAPRRSRRFDPNVFTEKIVPILLVVLVLILVAVVVITAVSLVS